MAFPLGRLLIPALALLPAACGTSSSDNPVKAAFAQRPPARNAPPVAFRFPEKAGGTVRVYRLPRFDEATFRFNTPGLTVSRVVGYSDDDDQFYVLTQRGTLQTLDLGTGRARMVDSGIAAAVEGPTGTPFYVRNDGAVATVEHRVAVPWPGAKLSQPPAAIIGAGRGTLIVETKSGKTRQVVTLAQNRPAVTQAIPDGPVTASDWGDVVAVASDSGVVLLNPARVQPPLLLETKSRAGAVAFSPSAHRVYAATGAELHIFDRFSGDELTRRTLPGPIAEIRPDDWGRYLLLRPVSGDSIWLFETSGNRYVATLGGAWSRDLPVVAADGSILSRQGNDLVAIRGDSLTTVGRLRGIGTDKWETITWDPRRPALQLADEAEPSATDASSEQFLVQVSASQNQSFADEMAQNLKRSGMPATVLPPGTPEELYRVVIGPYPTRDAADAAGRKLGKSYWVFSRGQAPATP